MMRCFGYLGAILFFIFSANLLAGDLANHSVTIRVVYRNSLSCVATGSVNDEEMYTIRWQIDPNFKKITVSIPKSQLDCHRDLCTVSMTTGVKLFEKRFYIKEEIFLTLIDAN